MLRQYRTGEMVVAWPEYPLTLVLCLPPTRVAFPKTEGAVEVAVTSVWWMLNYQPCHYSDTTLLYTSFFPFPFVTTAESRVSCPVTAVVAWSAANMVISAGSVGNHLS